QAEDGIRDIGVTGVQTCALPISIVGAPYPGLGPNRDGTSPDLVFARRRVRDRSSHLRLCRLFYEADRRPRLAARPENQPRRYLVAPVCVFALNGTRRSAGCLDGRRRTALRHRALV